MTIDKPTDQDSTVKQAGKAAPKPTAKKVAAPAKASEKTAQSKQVVKQSGAPQTTAATTSKSTTSASSKTKAEAKTAPKTQTTKQQPKPAPKSSVPISTQKKSAAQGAPQIATIEGNPPIAAPATPAPKKPVPKAHIRRPTKTMLGKRLPAFIQLMRIDKPIGILLLLWPTLWALWLAAKGFPSIKNLVIFCLGVVLMRSAGCVINDFADRKIDGKVQRTQGRPLAAGTISSREALILFVCLCLAAFGLVLLTDPLTIKLSVGGLLLAFSYPFMKRYTHLPQVVLGAAFAWGIPMAYAAETGALDKNMWLIYLAVVLWTVVYDTFYAMVDRDDDLKIGVKSTAILFGEQDRFITGTLQAMVIYAMVLVGKAYALGWIFYLSLSLAAGLFIYQQWLIRFRERTACFKAFLNNNWVGAIIFAGIAVDLAIK
jgi:4-hydroxybenzoate polyprenyltransferase